MSGGSADPVTALRPVTAGGSLHRLRGLATPTAAALIVDRSMLVRMASGVDAERLIGNPLQAAIDAGEGYGRLEQAVRHAAAGVGSELELPIGGAPRTVECEPLSGDLAAGEGLVLVEVAEARPAEAELAAARARAEELEALAFAARRLARVEHRDEIAAIVSSGAAALAGADYAAVIERAADGDSLVVAATSSDQLDRRTSPAGQAFHAASAFASGRPETNAAISVAGLASAWPLGRAAAAAGRWQPIVRGDAVEAVIAIGWRERPPSGELSTDAVELLAEEAAVAIERVEALEHLTEMARTDPLTELSNRRAWQDELARELARAERSSQRLAVGLIDLDELKAYNDRWGHAAGDRVLLTAARRWRRRLRLTDLLARIGGDEFAVAMPGCGLEQAVELGDQLRAALPDGVTCSIGVAEWSGAEPPAELLARADQALYAAKTSGRDATSSLPTPAGPRSGRPLPSS